MSRLAFKLGRAMSPAARCLVPKILFAHVVAEVTARCASPREVNRELFKLGVGAGDLVAVVTAAPTHLKRMWPSGGEASRVAGFSKWVFSSAWLTLTGRPPTVKAEVSGDRLVWVELEERPGEDVFYKIVVPEGVNPLYFAAGALEGCAQAVLRVLGADWFSFWRPLGRRGARGFLSSSAKAAEEVASAIVSRAPDFFADVTWEDSVKALDEALGARAPIAPKRAT